MRGGRFRILALALSLLAACASREPVREPAPKPPEPPPVPEAPAAETPAVYPFPAAAPREEAKGNGIKGGGGAVPVRAEAPPKPGPPSDEVLRLQREAVERDPSRDDEKLRLALLLAAAGKLEEAEKALSGIRARANRIIPALEFFLRRELGDHREAGRLLGQFVEEGKRVTGFVIERAELCSRVRRFREYVPAESDRVKPGGKVILYVEPRNFALSREGDKHILHLRYEWKLFDDRSVEQPVPAWEGAAPSDREDRILLNGPVEEFYQIFTLPLPEVLAAGPYRIKVTVTDVPSGKSDRVYVPIHVTGREKER